MDTSMYKLKPGPTGETLVICAACDAPVVRTDGEPRVEGVSGGAVGLPLDMFEAMGLMTRHHWSTHATAISLPQESGKAFIDNGPIAERALIGDTPARVPGDQRSHLRARETHEEYLIRTGRWSG